METERICMCYYFLEKKNACAIILSEFMSVTDHILSLLLFEESDKVTRHQHCDVRLLVC